MTAPTPAPQYSRIRSYLPWGFVHRWQGVTPPLQPLSHLASEILTSLLPRALLTAEPLRDLSGRLGDDGSRSLVGLPASQEGELLYIAGEMPRALSEELNTIETSDPSEVGNDFRGVGGRGLLKTELLETGLLDGELPHSDEARTDTVPFWIRVRTTFDRFEGTRAIVHTVHIQGHEAPTDLTLREWLLTEGVVVQQLRVAVQRYERRFASVLGYSPSPVERILLEAVETELSIVGVVEDPKENAQEVLLGEHVLLHRVLLLAGFLKKDS